MQDPLRLHVIDESDTGHYRTIEFSGRPMMGDIIHIPDPTGRSSDESFEVKRMEWKPFNGCGPIFYGTLFVKKIKL